jgi:hypothetical protein
MRTALTDACKDLWDDVLSPCSAKHCTLPTEGNMWVIKTTKQQFEVRHFFTPRSSSAKFKLAMSHVTLLSQVVNDELLITL